MGWGGEGGGGLGGGLGGVLVMCLGVTSVAELEDESHDGILEEPCDHRGGADGSVGSERPFPEDDPQGL